MNAIHTLDALRPVVRAMEDTLTFVAACDALRTKHAVDWVSIKKEAKEKGIATPASIDKHPDRIIIRHLCSPGAWQNGGDHRSAAYRTKAALARQVRAVSADLDDETATAVATRDVTSRFRVKVSPTTPTPAAADRTAHFTAAPAAADRTAHFTYFVTRRVVRSVHFFYDLFLC